MEFEGFMSNPAAPILDIDIFTDENLANSGPIFKQMRDTGEAVWIPKLNLYVIARYEGVKKALAAADTLINGHGVAVNENLNKMALGPVKISSILTDGMDHRKYKKHLMKPMRPNAIESLKGRLQEQANIVVDQVSGEDTFDAMEQLCCHIPYHLIADMVGIDGIDTAAVSKWATAAFDAWGPNELPRTQAAFKNFVGLPAYLATIERGMIRKGSWAELIFEAGDRGEIPVAQCKNLVFDYVIPSMDTTIHATAEMIYKLGAVEGAYDAVRADRTLVRGVVLESVRMATPIRGHTRYAAEDFELSDDIRIPKGSRVWTMFAAANRDERKYDNPDDFDVTRNPIDHLGWGYGAHACLGKHLSIVEMEAILNALLDKVKRIEIIGEPERLINSEAQGYETLPIRLHS